MKAMEDDCIFVQIKLSNELLMLDHSGAMKRRFEGFLENPDGIF